jgi:hypothetical protein
LILNPPIIALISGSILLSFFSLYASLIGVRIILWWDIGSGSERQLILERKTYLISTLLTYLLVIEFLSLFLYVYTADALHEVFVGAMCAAGSLNAGPCGYLTLVVKLLNVMLCGTWLIVNAIDNRGFDYPLIRQKYKLLLFISLMLTLEAFLQFDYFSSLRANVITSCCGTLFSESQTTLMGDLSAISPGWGKIVFFVSFLLTVRLGAYFLWTRKGARMFSTSGLWFFLFSIVALISFVSVYYYELPTHHCPFCILQKEYHFVGYPLYLTLLAGGVMGASVGILDRLKGPDSLREIIPSAQRKLCMGSLICFALFMALAVYPMVSSSFKLETG